MSASSAGPRTLHNRRPAVALLAGDRAEQIDRSGLGVAHRRAAIAAPAAGGDLAGDAAGDRAAPADRSPRSGRLRHRDRRSSRAPCGCCRCLGRQAAPDHPPAEGIVLRHAVQGDQGPAGGRRRDRAQGNALGGGISAGAGARPVRDAPGDVSSTWSRRGVDARSWVEICTTAKAASAGEKAARGAESQRASVAGGKSIGIG